MLNRLKFNKTAMLGLPLIEVGKRVTYYNTVTSKLALRVTASGVKSFYMVKRAGGQMVWLEPGGFTDMTDEKVQKAALTASIR